MNKSTFNRESILHYYMYLIFFAVLFIVLSIFYSINRKCELFENIKADVGNFICEYFYNYAKSILKREDFVFSKHESILLKDLPTQIPFNQSLLNLLLEKNINIEKLETIGANTLWECNENYAMDIWTVLRPTIHRILEKAIEQSGLKREPLSTIIHFRCADTPFIKHPNYFLQKYSFFKECLDQINPSEKHIVLMNCSKHKSEQKDQESCSSYIEKLSSYFKSEGYSVEIRCKTNAEDFADLFYAHAVISTGGSFSFMSGFFGKGKFLSTEHILNGKSCTTNECNAVFVRGHNIMHEEVESYYDIDSVYSLLTAPLSTQQKRM